jgi:hypothetical protein
VLTVINGSGAPAWYGGKAPTRGRSRSWHAEVGSRNQSGIGTPGQRKPTPDGTETQ